MQSIHDAAHWGNFRRVTEILRNDPSQVHARKESGDQPLHFAAWQGRKKVAAYLLDSGADINSHGESGQTPLHYAITERHPAVVKLLLDRGADVNLRDNRGWTPLYLVAACGEDETVKQLLRAGAEKDLNSRIYLDGADRVLELLRPDPSLLHDVAWPESLLKDAIRVRSPRLVQFLLTHGIDANKGVTSDPPLIQAIAEGTADVVRVLLDHGADITTKDRLGEGVLAIASTCRVGDDIINVLKEYGATE
jgi:uncharacterized protein